MRSFVHNGLASRIVFGNGTSAHVAAEIDRLGATKAMLLTDGRPWHGADDVANALGSLLACRFDGAVMHTPVAVSEKAAALAREHGADCLVALGGGSVTGLAKAVSVRTGLPQVVLPTTYAGSEVTPVLGETEDGVKTTRSGPEILPGTVIYDVAFTTDLSFEMTLTSAVNAMAHAVEALYAPEANPLVDALALRAIGAIFRAVPALRVNPSDVDARAELLEAAWLAGTCLASAGMGLHHKLCHVLGGRGMPHAATHTAVLPHVIAFNAPAVPDVMRRIGAVIGTDDVAGAVHYLVASCGGPTSLALLGLSRHDIASVAQQVTAATYPNPRTPTTDEVRVLLEEAWTGARPGPSTTSLTAQVVSSFDAAPDQRFRLLMCEAVRRLHAFVTDLDVTQDEWERAVGFLTRVGQTSTPQRQEMILLSDVLGVSSTVDAQTHARTPDSTPSAVLGPFYVEGPPSVPHGIDLAAGLPGTPLWSEIRVTGAGGTPIDGAVVDVWQSNDDGFYDLQLPDQDGPVLRARFRTDRDGFLRYWSIVPSEYPIPADGPVGDLLRTAGRHPYRAPHVHFMINAPGHHRLITQLFVEGGRFVDSDTVFGVKPELVVPMPPQPGRPPEGRTVEGPWHKLEFTFRLAAS